MVSTVRKKKGTILSVEFASSRLEKAEMIVHMFIFLDDTRNLKWLPKLLSIPPMNIKILLNKLTIFLMGVVCAQKNNKMYNKGAVWRINKENILRSVYSLENNLSSNYIYKTLNYTIAREKRHGCKPEVQEMAVLIKIGKINLSSI